MTGEGCARVRGYAEYRLHAHKRIRRRDDDGIGALQCADDLRRSLRRLCAVKEDALDHWLPLPMHKVFLKLQHALIGFDQRPKAIIRHRQDRRLNAERARDDLRGFGQRLALPQQRGAIHMRRQIAVANVEPRLSTQSPQRAERFEGIAGHTPAGNARSPVRPACTSPYRDRGRRTGRAIQNHRPC